MNKTAEMLRKAACGAENLYGAIPVLREEMGLGRAPSISQDLWGIFASVADELDALQERAVRAGDALAKRESAEAKAERRKKQAGYLAATITERNAQLKERGRRIHELNLEIGRLRKQMPTEGEREILDMWPRFEDTGEPVMVGDAYVDTDGDDNIVAAVRFDRGCADLVGAEGFYTGFDPGERVKRPVQSVLDADGVEIEVGDTVWCKVCGGPLTVESIDGNGCVYTVCDEDVGNVAHTGDELTHREPDSWERLEEDARGGACSYRMKASEDYDCPGITCAKCTQDFTTGLVARARLLAEAM